MNTPRLLPSRVNVKNEKFAASHGRLPRGTGYWLFCPADKWADADYINHVISANGTFADARAEAQRKAAALGIDCLYTCP